MRALINKVGDSVYMYPVAWAGFIRSITLCATAFGFHLTADQIASLMLVLESGLTVFTHQNVIPSVKVLNANDH